MFVVVQLVQLVRGTETLNFGYGIIMPCRIPFIDDGVCEATPERHPWYDLYCTMEQTL